MGEHSFPPLSPAGQQRREEILQSGLAAARSHRRTRQRIRVAAALCAVTLLGWTWFRTGSPRSADNLAGTNPQQDSEDSAPKPVLVFETLNDESLLAQLDAAGLPYLQLSNGEVRLIPASHDSWIDEPEPSDEL